MNNKMIDFVSTNGSILDFLSKYPEPIRKQCAEAVMIYGVRTIKNKFPYGLSANQLLSVAGISEIESSQSKAISSLNNSVANNKSLDYNRFLNESQMNFDERTEKIREKIRETRGKANERSMNRTSSEKKMVFSNKIKEPETCAYETAKTFFSDAKNYDLEEENEVMKIAEDFLKNSYANYLTAPSVYENKAFSRSYFTKRK